MISYLPSNFTCSKALEMKAHCFFTKLKECTLSNFAFLAVLRCQMINDNQRWLSLAPKDCGVTMQRIVYLIDTYFFDHMHPLSPKMTTKNHFIIGTILKSITIYHSFSTYWCLYLDKNIRVINPWF